MPAKSAELFDLTGAGTALDDLAIDVKGTGVEAAIFGGQVHDAQLDLRIRNDSLTGNGERSIPEYRLGDPDRGSACRRNSQRRIQHGRIDPRIVQHRIQQRLEPAVRVGLAVVVASQRHRHRECVDVRRDDRGLATISNAEAKTAIGNATGKGRISLSRGESDFSYEAEIVDAARLKDFISLDIQGAGTFRGRLVGPESTTRWWTARSLRQTLTLPA